MRRPRRTISALLLIAATLFPLAALSLSCQTSHAQATNPTPKKAVAASQPATAPAPRPVTWYATTKPSQYASGSDALPLDLPRIFRVWKPGDTIALHGGETFPGITFAKALAGPITITSYLGRATIDAPTGMLMNLVTGDWDIGNINFIDSTRNPAKVAFVPHVGGYGIIMLGGNAAHLHIHDCSFQWHAIAISVQTATNQHGTLIERCRIGPTYGISQRAQGIYAEGQYDATIQDSYFDTCGWWAGLAPADNQCHAIYYHGGDAQACGPLNCRRCTFVNCAASGPTSNCGGTVDSCILIDCANDGSGMAAWISADSGTFTNNIVVNGWYNAISKDAVVTGNLFIDPGTFSVNVDVPSGAKNWRQATNHVSTDRNVSFGGGPAVVRQNNLGGGVYQGGSDVSLPANPNLESVVRQAAKARAGQ